MTDADRYQVRRKPGGYIRVVDLEEQQTDGYWIEDENRWFDVQAFIGESDD